jgi:hypothetical protein
MSSIQGPNECVIRWWRGYVKSCFFALLEPSSPNDPVLVESPLFWSLRKRSLSAEGPPAAAHRLLVDALLQQGWRPAGVGESWYEQRFVWEGGIGVANDAAPSAPAEAAPIRRDTSPAPARPSTAEDRSLRVVTERTSPQAAPEAPEPRPASKSPSSTQADRRAPRGPKKQRAARAKGTRPGAAKPRQRNHPSARATRGGFRGARSRGTGRLLAAAAPVGLAALVAVDVAVVLFALTGSS